MRVRRCTVLLLEPREEVSFDLAELLQGRTGLVRERRWLALAPHLAREIEVDASERELLGELSPGEWSDSRDLSPHPKRAFTRLLREGLLIAAGTRHAAHRARDEMIRDLHWHPLSAVQHAFTRWTDVDANQAMLDIGVETIQKLRNTLGRPPAHLHARAAPEQRLPLPRPSATSFDQLLARRTTCRNFDADRALPLELYSRMLQRVFAAQGVVHVGEDTTFLKKTSPSGGGLHPTEAYLIVQHVQDVAPGLYHYHAGEHALEPIAAPARALPDVVLDLLAGQHWFANAHAMAVLVPRFARSFWKYRRHAKAYRAAILDSGHLSQTLYLSATELGLGAFVTSAINEAQVEALFGLDPMTEGPLAVCGFGWRAERMETTEFDPVGEVWEAGV